MSALVLYAIPHSSYCAKTRILLRFKKLAWEERLPPGGAGSPDYKAIVPTGNLPALAHNGFLLADSEAIAEYLEERFPEQPALPKDVKARAKARERSRLHDTRFNPALAKVYPFVGNYNEHGPAIDTVFHDVEERLRQFDVMLERGGGPPETLTLGDCGFPISFAWTDKISEAVHRPVAWPESVLAYRRTVEAFTPVADELRSYSPHMDGWIRAKLKGA